MNAICRVTGMMENHGICPQHGTDSCLQAYKPDPKYYPTQQRMISQSPTSRWEQGIPHRPECNKLFQILKKYDELSGIIDYGGDSSPSETIKFALDDLIDQGVITLIINK